MTTTPIKALFAVPRIGMRLLFIREFQRNQEIRLASLAFSYEVAIDQLRDNQHIDIIVLDCVEGLVDPVDLVNSIRSVRTGVPIVLLCDHSVQAKTRMLDAIRAGASDYIVAPTGSSTDENMALLRGPLTQKIHTWAHRSAHRSGLNPSAQPTPVEKPRVSAPDVSRQTKPRTGAWNPTRPRNRIQTESAKPLGESTQEPSFKQSVSQVSESRQPSRHDPNTERPPAIPDPVKPEILAIASSTGGPAALKQVLGNLQGDLPIPIVCVQHNLVGFDKLLVQQLNSQSRLTVHVAEQGQALQPGNVYVAPADLHMTLKKQANHYTIELSDGPFVCEVRPAADILFQSVARHFRHRALGLVLTGMGVDGLEGSRSIRQAGGKVMVQSGPTCTVWGMPRAVEQAGLANSVLDLKIIAPTMQGLLNPNLQSKPQDRKTIPNTETQPYSADTTQ